MGADNTGMTREQIRAALLAKIEAAWPKYMKSAELARQIRLASNDELRKHLAMAEVVADEVSRIKEEPTWPEPDQGLTLSPRYSEADRERFGKVLRTAWNPDGGYTLAKDECGDWFVGPAWVPFNLFSCANNCGGSSVEKECANTLINAAGAEKLWSDIEAKYGRGHCHNSGLDARRNNFVDSIAASLPTVCADAKANWASIPLLTPSKFKEHREELSRRAEQLALELERFYLPRDPDEYEFPGLLDFTDLMTHEERERLDQAIRGVTSRIGNRARNRAGMPGADWAEYNSIGEEARALGYRDEDLFTPAREDAMEVYALMLLDRTQYNSTDWYGGVPTLPNMLRRIAKKFEEDGNDPPIKNPNLGNAERNFFARFLCKYFWMSYGTVSPAIVRDIVTMFYAQGIEENDVSQMVRKIKEAHPLP